MNRIAVFNQKGGVGKTTTVLNLSAALHHHQQNHCLIDMDPQAHLTHVLCKKTIAAEHSLYAFYTKGVTLKSLKQPGDKVREIIPANKAMIKLDAEYGKGMAILLKLKTGLESEQEALAPTVLMDCCPYLGVLSLNAIFAADLILVPIASDYLSYQGAINVEKTLSALEPVIKRRIPRRYLLTRYDKRRSVTFSIEKKARKSFEHNICQTVIRDNVAILESPQYFQDVFSYQPKSKGAHDYQALMMELKSEGLI